jgi:hypothetical protein
LQISAGDFSLKSLLSSIKAQKQRPNYYIRGTFCSVSKKQKQKKNPDSSLKGILSMIVKIIHPWSGMAFPHNDQVKCYAPFTQGREFEELA